MKVKCAICGEKGWFELKDMSEFHASRFLLIHINKNKKEYLSSDNSKCICRKCIHAVLDSLQSEQYRIDGLYKPIIKEK